MIDGLQSMKILKCSSELQVRDAAIATDTQDLPVESSKGTHDMCLHRVGKTLKTNKANTLQSTTYNL